MVSCCNCVCCCCVCCCLYGACGQAPGTTTVVVSLLALIYWYLPDLEVYVPSSALEELPAPTEAEPLPFQWLLPVFIAAGTFLIVSPQKKKVVCVYLALWYLQEAIGDLQWLLGSVGSSITCFAIDFLYFSSALKQLSIPALNSHLLSLVCIVSQLLYATYYHRNAVLSTLVQLQQLPSYSWEQMLPAVYFSVKYIIVFSVMLLAGILLFVEENYLNQGQKSLGIIISEEVSSQANFRHTPYRYYTNSASDSVSNATFYYFLAFLSAAGALSVLWGASALFNWTIEEVPWLLDTAAGLCFSFAAALSMVRDVPARVKPVSILSTLLAVWISLVIIPTVRQALV